MPARPTRNPQLAEPRWVRRGLIALALAFVALFLLAPLAVVFGQALAEGVGAWLRAIRQPEALSAIRLTLLAAAVAVPLNLAFGVAAAWLLARFEFRGKGLLAALIDLPLSVSPVIAGLIFVLVFGHHGLLGPLLERLGLQVIFAPPGIVLATLFVTFPLVAREVLPVMQAQGASEEEAALTLGASGWQTFLRVTLPKAKWGLLYGAVLCNARAMGEFGAVSVVSGHIRNATNTVPLHVEILYDDYDFTAAFAVASLLTVVAVFTLVMKQLVERRSRPRAAPLAATQHAAQPSEEAVAAAKTALREPEAA